MVGQGKRNRHKDCDCFLIFVLNIDLGCILIFNLIIDCNCFLIYVLNTVGVSNIDCR